MIKVLMERDLPASFDVTDDTGKTRTGINLLAIRRVQLQINRTLNEVARKAMQ